MSSTRNLPAAFQTAREAAATCFIQCPLPRSPGHFTVRRSYMVDVRYRVQLARDFPDHEYPNAYHAGETEVEQIDNLLRFERLFSTIPDSWDEVGSANFSAPGFNDPPTLAAAVNITAAMDWRGTWILTAASHGYSAGDKVRISARFRSSFGSAYDVVFSGDYHLEAVSTDTVTIHGGPAGAGSFSVTYGSMSKYTAGYPIRLPRTVNVPTRVVYDYFLPGQSAGVDGIHAIPIFPAFRPMTVSGSGSGEETDTLTSSTAPTVAQYWAAMQDRAELVLECTLDPYLGNIIRRRTVYALAR